MPSLSDKLKGMGVTIGTGNIQPRKKKESVDLHTILGGGYWSNSHGNIFVVEDILPDEYQQGDVPIRLSGSLEVLGQYLQAEGLSEFDHHSIGFLDTETTGLSGGTGTLAFMVGVGKFVDNQFHLAQFFLHDISSEPALLVALEQFLLPCQMLVTFNGKSFDLPLLKTRYLLQGWRDPIGEKLQVDLLHLARRLWKDRLPSRTLINLEAQILHAARSDDDIPGWMIPQMYFDYLRDGDAIPLKSVFYHNSVDVISMAALLNHACKILSAPQSSSDIPGVDLYSIAKFHEDYGDLETAIELYIKFLDHDEFQIDSELTYFYTEAILRLANIHKRRDQIVPAMELWERAVEYKSIQACVELAMVKEHRQKDFQSAVYWTQIAIDLLTKGSDNISDEFLMDALQHRLSRIYRKIGDD